MLFVIQLCPLFADDEIVRPAGPLSEPPRGDVGSRIHNVSAGAILSKCDE
jgi:hypothetical protein